MLPVTHYLYLALALFGVGLGGAVLRRSLVVALLGVFLMLVAVALCLCAYARFFVDPGGQVSALLIVLAGLCELGVVAAIALRGLRAASSASDTGLAPAPTLLDDWAGTGTGTGARAGVGAKER